MSDLRERLSELLARHKSWQGEAKEQDDWLEHGDAIETLTEALAALVPSAIGEPKLDDIEQYRMQIAGICTAALGYWKEGDSVHPDYDTPALRDVAKLYAKYADLHAQSLVRVEVGDTQDAKDAARYRWLRTKVGVDEVGVWLPGGHNRVDGSKTDAAIDEALISYGDSQP